MMFLFVEFVFFRKIVPVTPVNKILRMKLLEDDLLLAARNHEVKLKVQNAIYVRYFNHYQSLEFF